MNINSSDLQSKLTVYQTAKAPENNSTAKSETSSRANIQQDRVVFSEQGRLLADAQRAMADVPDIRESLVAGIRNDLDNGSYVFDNQKIAEGILRESIVNQAAMM